MTTNMGLIKNKKRKPLGEGKEAPLLSIFFFLQSFPKAFIYVTVKTTWSLKVPVGLGVYETC